MPIYEFRCESCQKTHELLMKVSDKHPTECQSCGKGPLRKLMSQTSFVLKGTGWYATDFKGKGKKGAYVEDPDCNLDEGESTKKDAGSGSGADSGADSGAGAGASSGTGAGADTGKAEPAAPPAAPKPGGKDAAPAAPPPPAGS